MPLVDANPGDQALHLNAIRSPAVETGQDPAIVRRVYERGLARLQATAQITEYLLLACRRTREALFSALKSGRPEAVGA